MNFRKALLPLAVLAAMVAGSAHHAAFARNVRRAQRLKLLAWRLLAAGVLLLVLFVVFKLAGA